MGDPTETWRCHRPGAVRRPRLGAERRPRLGAELRPRLGAERRPRIEASTATCFHIGQQPQI